LTANLTDSSPELIFSSIKSVNDSQEYFKRDEDFVETSGSDSIAYLSPRADVETADRNRIAMAEARYLM
jgi:hypothetical protein